jgi:DNA-nicking Smr family endonuclease
VAKNKKPPPGFNTPFANVSLPKTPAPEPPARKPQPPARKPEAAPARPDPGPTADEQRAFQQAMYGVTPLSEAQRRRRTAPVAKTTAPSAHRARLARDEELARADLADLVQEHDQFSMEEVGEAVSGRAPGVDRRLLQQLRAGDYPVEAELDLHRRSRAQAGLELERFLAKARGEGRRCVLVIHGRGLNSGPEGPVLLAATRDWLTQAPLRRHVLAFASAPPSLGGTGAMLILLRRPKG